MKKVAIIAALDKEFAQIEALLSEKKHSKTGCGIPVVEGVFGNIAVVLAKSGIGKVCSAVGTLEIIKEFGPDCVVNTGVGGGIDSSLNVMDVVVSTRVAYHDVWCGEGEKGQVQGFPLYFEACKELVEIAAGVSAAVPVHTGLIVSGDQFISDKGQLAVIKSLFPDALAVDMESASIAHVCHMCEVPFMSLRIMSDTPGSHEDNFSQYTDFWKSIADNSFGVCRAFLQALSARV